MELISAKARNQSLLSLSYLLWQLIKADNDGGPYLTGAALELIFCYSEMRYKEAKEI